ncbi:UNVERIFIED_CONTAM: hypothetical protein Slati_1447500 [Sesamum latifolium]|uniref:Reverse transcriptase domain-containing protein n=1 Tax=Sesamum latifolium TaxID=2727402 RepID=A0AAW2X5P5_9LAMI
MRVFQINGDDGHTHMSSDAVAAEFVGFYQRLLGGRDAGGQLTWPSTDNGCLVLLNMDEGLRMVRPITREEVKAAFFDIAEDKSPGPNGYSSAFFKAAWPVVGEDVTTAILDFFLNGRLLKQVNATLLTLIPKVRPRLFGRSHSPTQNAFVPGRKIGDSVMLAQELFMGYNQRHLPKRCALKVDLRKVYDTVEWDFLIEVNPAKSQLILSKASNAERTQFIQILGFQEGVLPVRYLGLPLISSRLFLTDCRPLLQKIDDRIQGWAGTPLSFALRVQLIKSVLLALNTYWAMAFVLPKGLIREIERRLRSFLWKGTTGLGMLRLPGHEFARQLRKEA